MTTETIMTDYVAYYLNKYDHFVNQPLDSQIQTIISRYFMLSALRKIRNGHTHTQTQTIQTDMTNQVLSAAYFVHRKQA